MHVPGLRNLRIHYRHRPVTAEEAGHRIDRVHRRGQPNALHRRARDHLQPFQAERQVRSPLSPRHGVHFVHDDGLHSPQSPRCLGRQHEVERFRRGNQNLRWVAKHLSPLTRWGITAAYTHPQRRHRLPHRRGSAGDACQWCSQVSVDVNPQCLQRRNVQHTRSGLWGVREQRLLGEFRQRPEEGGQSLSGAGGRYYERIVALGNGIPRLVLHHRRFRKYIPKPRRYGGMKLV